MTEIRKVIKIAGAEYVQVPEVEPRTCVGCCFDSTGMESECIEAQNAGVCKGNIYVPLSSTIPDQHQQEPEPMTQPAKIDTIDTILTERGNRYGEFDVHASITQELKAVMHDSPNWRSNKLTPDMKEALEMIQHKIGRILNGDPFYKDSWVDISGYATLVAKTLKD